MLFRLSTPAWCLSIASLLSTSALARPWTVDSVSARSFIEMCRGPEQAASTADPMKAAVYSGCEAYLLGFFAGTMDVVVTEALPSSYTLRVLDSRGRRLNEHHQKLLNANYCISEEESLEAIVDKVAAMDPESIDDGNAVDVIERVLKQSYSCKRD